MPAMTSAAGTPLTTGLAHNQRIRTEGRVGDHLRRWRGRRGWSQLKVAADCNVSTRHLSFVETGRARASRELIVHLARSLGASNHELNACLLAGGYAPRHVVDLETGPATINATLVEMIRRHEPKPALVFNPDWVIERLNLSGQWLCSVVMPDLWATVRDPGAGMDMIATLIHDAGLLSHMCDAAAVGRAFLRQLRAEQLTNPGLRARVDLLEASLRERFPDYDESDELDRGDPSLHLQFDTAHGRLSFFTLQTVVGIPQQITVATPRVELWFPADRHTRGVMERQTFAPADHNECSDAHEGLPPQLCLPTGA